LRYAIIRIVHTLYSVTNQEGAIPAKKGLFPFEVSASKCKQWNAKQGGLFFKVATLKNMGMA
jgi:hypothetical protein